MLTPVIKHSWDLAPKEAIALQRDLAERVDTSGTVRQPELVAGVDVGLKRGMAKAGVVVLQLPGLQIVERVQAERPISYPYVPGLLTFR